MVTATEKQMAFEYDRLIAEPADDIEFEEPDRYED